MSENRDGPGGRPGDAGRAGDGPPGDAGRAGDGPPGDADGSNGGFLSDARLTIARRDVASLSREKTIVLAILIQLFVAAFSSFLVVGLTSLYSPGSVSGGEIVVGVAGEHKDALVDAASAQDGVRAVTYSSPAAAREVYREGSVHAVMVARDSGDRIAVEVIAPQGNIRTTLIVDKIRSLLEAVERAERIERATHLDRSVVPLPADVDASPYFGFTYTVLIPLLLFLPPFISGSIAVDALTEEIERGTLELLRVAPVSVVDIVDGKALGMVAIAPLQAAMWLGLLGLNGIRVSNVGPLLAMVTALTVAVVVLGLALGLLTGSRREAQLLYSTLVLFGFGTLVFLPEHPATTVAKLAVDSPTTTTFLHVAGYVLLAVVGYAVVRRFVGRVDPESL
ncbi:MAG: ABC transporter permease [Haloarculaceae archaeon]